MSEKFDAAYADMQRRRSGLLGRMGVKPYSLIWWIVAMPFAVAVFAISYMMLVLAFG